MRNTVVLLVLLVGCGHHLRVVVEPDGYCAVYRDGEPIGARQSPGVVVDLPEGLR